MEETKEPQPKLLDPTGEKRRRYIKRRDFVEKEFLEKTVNQQPITLENGAKIRVLSSYVEIPDELKRKRKPSEPVRVSVFVPGLFEARPPNLGNHPLETKLAGALLTGEVDVIFMLKAEGLNKEAFKENDHGIIQKRVSKAAHDVLKNSLEQQYPEETFEFRVSGYSEGATQAASLAARIAESELGKVKDLVSISGAGMVGAKIQEESKPVSFLKEALDERKKAPKPKELKGKRIKSDVPIVREGHNTFYIDSRFMGDEKSGGFEEALGRARVSTVNDIKNIGTWGLRLLTTELTGGRIEEVPTERLKAATTINPDYEELVKRDIPIFVFSETEEIFFPNTQVRKKVNELRNKGGRVILISAGGAGHEFAHYNPSGVAYAIETVKRKVGLE